MRDLEELRKLHSSKWLRYPADVLPLHVAEMDFEVDGEINNLDLSVDLAIMKGKDFDLDLSFLNEVSEEEIKLSDET